MQALDNYINEVKTLPPAPRILSQLLVILNQDDACYRPDRRTHCF